MEHPVAIKVDIVVKYLETGRMLTGLAPCRIHRVYRYANDFLAALAGLGLPPAAAVLSKALSGSQSAVASPAANSAGNSGPELWRSLQELPPVLGWASLVLILAFVGVKVYVNQANTEKKLALAESSQNQFNNFTDELDSVLDQAEPMEPLNSLLGRLRELKQLCVTSEVWIWSPFPETDDFGNRCKRRSENLKNQFEHCWKPAPTEPGVTGQI